MSSRFSCTISIYISIRGLLLFLLQKRLICWLTIKMFMYSRKHIHVCMQAIAVMYLTGNENSHSLRCSHNWNFLLVMLWRKFSDWILNPVFTLLNFIYISILLTRAKCVCSCIWPNKMFLLAKLSQSAGGWAWLYYMTCIWKDTININN